MVEWITWRPGRSGLVLVSRSGLSRSRGLVEQGGNCTGSWRSCRRKLERRSRDKPSWNSRSERQLYRLGGTRICLDRPKRNAGPEHPNSSQFGLGVGGCTCDQRRGPDCWSGYGERNATCVPPDAAVYIVTNRNWPSFQLLSSVPEDLPRSERSIFFWAGWRRAALLVCSGRA